MIEGDFFRRLTKIAQDVLELSQQDGAVLVLVVQLAQLNVVVVVAGAVGLLDGLLHELDDLIVLAELLAEVVGLAELDGGLLDDVHAQSIEDVHEVVHVDLAFGIPIVDGADLLDFISVDRHVGFDLGDLKILDFKRLKRPTPESSLCATEELS